MVPVGPFGASCLGAGLLEDELLDPLELEELLELWVPLEQALTSMAINIRTARPERNRKFLNLIASPSVFSPIPKSQLT